MAPRNIFENFRRRARQSEATTGRPLAPGLTKSFLEAELSTEAERLGAEAEREERLLTSRAVREQRADEIKAQRGANVVRGATGLVTAAGALSDTSLGTAVTGAVKRTASRIAPSLATPASTEALVGPLTGAPIDTLGAGVLPSSSGATPALTAGGVAGGAGVSFIGGQVAEEIFGEGTAATLGGNVAAGALYGSLVPGVGTLIGAGIGAVTGIVDEATVICTELHRQGYISTEVLAGDDHRIHSDIDEEIYAGYMRWAPTVVSAMQKSWLVTQLVRPFGVGWAHHMAHRIDKTIPDSLVGKIIYKIGVPICKRLGREDAEFTRVIG